MTDRNQRLLNRILLIILAVVAAVILFGTAAVLVSRKNKVTSYRKADPEPQKVVNLSKKSTDKVDAYTDLKEIRLFTKPEEGQSNGTLLVVSPWFSYPQGDKVLYEELAQKDKQLSNIISSYFASRTKSQLLSTGEQKIKEDLTDLINQELVLGKIKAVYFKEYIFFE